MYLGFNALGVARGTISIEIVPRATPRALKPKYIIQVYF